MANNFIPTMASERPNKRQRQQAQEHALLLTDILPDPEKTTVVKIGDVLTEINEKQSKYQRKIIVDGVRVSPPIQNWIPQKPILDNDFPQSLLQNMLFPVAETAFLDKYFRKCAVHIPALQSNTGDGENETTQDAAVQRMQCVTEQLYDLDPEQLFRETSSDSIFVWLRASTNSNNSNNNDKKNSNDSSKKTLINSIEVSDPDMAMALYHAGNATYCRAPCAVEQKLVAALLENTGLGCGQYEGDPGNASGLANSVTCMGRGEVEVFLSAAAGHLTNWHYDFQENFTLQLSGTKRWTMQKGTVKHPLRGCTPHYASPGTVEPQLKAAHLADPNFEFGHPERGVNATGEVESVLLQPGDVFYFPAGMWHKVEVIEPGVSINISLMATNYATITCQALQHLLLKEDQWREAVVRNHETGVVGHLKKLLKELPKVIKDFEESGGANWIIPPVLRHGKLTRDPLDDDDDDGEEDDDGDFTEDSDEEKEEGIIDFLTFEPPADTPVLIRRDCTIVKNPLASLISEKSIAAFYHGSNPDTTNDEIFVLNVNYAGNESHESTVRVRIKDDDGRLDRIIQMFHLHEARPKHYGATRMPCHVEGMSAEDWKLYECLIYFGYMKVYVNK